MDLKQKTGLFSPEAPRFTIQDFMDEFRDSTLSQKQIEELYYDKQDE